MDVGSVWSEILVGGLRGLVPGTGPNPPCSTGIVDSLPRSRPTFATWSNLSILNVALAFAVVGAMGTTVFARVNLTPVLFVVVGIELTLGFAVPITVGTALAPSLRPIRDLAEGTERVAAGDYSQRVPVVQDDELGALAASFNRMQAGLAERQRLQDAFGTTSLRPRPQQPSLELGDASGFGLDPRRSSPYRIGLTPIG
jgi:HAMP domain-containing protein